jgi:hypothetical protein
MTITETNLEVKMTQQATMNESPSTLRHDQVAKLAYEIWEENGRPSGTAEKDWLLAENCHWSNRFRSY